MAKKNTPLLAISTLDDIAWLFNLRGADIPFNPVFFSYAVVTEHSAILYILESKVSTECRDHLRLSGVEVRPYDTALSEFQGFSKDLLRSHEISDGTLSTRFFISDKASWAVKLAFGGDETVEEGCNPVSEFKAVKNSVEISGMRACHVRDGAALVEFLAWLEDQLVTKRTSLDEVAAADKLEQLRAKQKYFMGLAFPTISAAGAK
jgi:Xaa-Pro aminopeptidase